MKLLSRLGLLLTSCLTLTAAAPAALAAADPAYPALDGKQLGQVRNIVELARQPDHDWSDMKVGNRSAFDNSQFQIAWMYYALAVAQSQQTPAYRELYQATSDELIRKMTLPEVWALWGKIIEAPQFKKYLDQTKDWRDPVRAKNIMYSGHLLQMIGLYELLYQDGKYDKPDAITFAITGENPFVHTYNHESLAKIIHAQFFENAFAGIECEPNLVFAECNQHPVLGLMNYDQLHGTKLADVKTAFWDKAMSLGYLDTKKTKRFTGPYRLKEEQLVAFPSGWNDGWTGVTLHGWNRELVNQVYPMQRDAALPALLDQNPETFKNRWNQTSVSSDFGFLAAYSAEVGDQATTQKMLGFADTHFKPVWRDGRYLYPLNDPKVPGAPERLTGDEVPGSGSKTPPAPLTDDQLGDYLVGPLNGNALLAFARLNPGNGLWNLTNNLAGTYAVKGPQIVGVDYPKVLVNQAYYDQSRGVLAIGLAPGTDYRGSVTFNVRSLPKGSYTILLDGQPAASIAGRRIKPITEELAASWTKSGELNLALPLNEGRAIRIEKLRGDRIAAR
ncbi:hypothetical protein KFK14_22830 [Sphingobium phenoxybenzoativorans]|uniref:Linalool dehydratase/isomerase domain-containing protein n=1 Tax=Sphingobium phenoxybenzoativorans TaxID=1592790 RepID=A0A975Q1J8_9SPHN|nr:hypothetical protein [Sphingobium phenoxybenzoativorans]QUT05741.1 hypothetical protein KFK14_22830 [Sphingobium phenoxybenzoativorans]